MTHLRGIWERCGGQNGDEGGCHWCSDTCRGCWRGVEVRMETMGNVIGGAGEFVGHTHTCVHNYAHTQIHAYIPLPTTPSQ